MLKRTMTTTGRHRSRTLSPGVFAESLYPGGIAGPNDEIALPTPGGQSWSDVVMLGDATDPFQLMLPDIRMPANQYWPLHWHDCWTVVLVVEGTCCIGDWWMEPGDVFVTLPSLEYGPMLIGPAGAGLFESFAQAHLAGGGYAPEYADHPTLRLSPGRVFAERSSLNRRNDGRQTLSCDTDGIWQSRLTPGAVWDLGDADDPDRGMMSDRRLAAGERIAPHSYADWHLVLVMAGSITIDGMTLAKDDFLRIAPGAAVGAIDAGGEGAQLLELARTARGLAPQPVPPQE